MRAFILMAVACGVSVSGCSTVFNNATEASRPSERHPITVDQQTVSVRIPVDPTLSGLSRDALAQIDGFLTAYRTRGHGPITVTAPSSGQGIDVDGQQTAADIRTALYAFGLQYEDMQGATYRTNNRERDVIISFTRYVASGPTCGDFAGEQVSRLRNLPAPNFGCAFQANLAAMVADPRDLTSSTSMDPALGAGPAAAARAIATGVSSFDEEIGLGALPGGSDE